MITMMIIMMIIMIVGRAALYGQALIFTEKLNTNKYRWNTDECICHQSHGNS